MPRITIAESAASLLAEHRALRSDELGRLIAERGATRAKDPARAVSRALDVDPRFRRLSDGRWVVPAQLLNGATFTHRLTGGEAAADVLALTPDLTPLVAVVPGGLLLPDGQPLSIVWDADAAEASHVETDAALQGPPGWLPEGAAGRLMHMRLTGAILRVELAPRARTTSRPAVRRLVEAARTVLSEQEAAGFLFLPPAVSLDTLILDQVADDPRLVEHPLPPLGEAFAAAGLEVHRSFVGPPGTDWASLDELMSFGDDNLDDMDQDDAFADEETGQAMLEALDLTPQDLEGLEIVLGAYELSQRMGGFEGSETYARLGQMFAWPGIARMLVHKAWTDAAFEPFAVAIATATTGSDAAGPLLVVAACAEARDDVAAAERLLHSALDADPDHPLVLAEVARYEIDRGDYGAALRHLRAAGAAPDDAERAWLEALTRPALPKVGRNERCPCGSGRKYKACHLDSRAEIEPVDIAHALLHKLRMWASQPSMERSAGEILREAGAQEFVEAGDPGPIAPVLADVVLFDRGGLRRFLEVRGGLLPAAERALGRSWLLTRRSLHEVQAVRPGEGLTLRDLRTAGDPIEVPDRSLSSGVRPLDLLCLRLLPDGAGGVVASDAVLVPRLQRRHVLDLLDAGDPLALLRWVTAPAPPLRLTNTEGEPLLLVTAAYRIADPTAVAVALGKKLRDGEDGRFTEIIVKRGQEWIRGSITLEDDRASIVANSRQRADRLERMLLRAAPGAQLLRREEHDVAEGATTGEAAHGSSMQPIDVGAHPELAQAMETFIRASEARWVDEQIPALGGLTPRQALADPDARPELEALLDDMAWQRDHAAGGATLMDPSRVRALLSMPEQSR